MKKWEYYYAWKGASGTANAGWNVPGVAEGWDRVDVFNYLGERGWELITHDVFSNGDGYIFKREKA